MSEILIKGLELPKDGFTRMMLWSDGGVAIEVSPNNYEQLDDNAIELQPHGDLIDRSLALGACHEMARSLDMEGAFEVIENAPTVIEASKERE